MHVHAAGTSAMSKGGNNGYYNGFRAPRRMRHIPQGLDPPLQNFLE